MTTARPLAYSGSAPPPRRVDSDGHREGRAIALQRALAGLVRAWIDIILDQPPTARGLLLLLFLATLALYALGLASMVVAARLAAVPAEEPAARIVRRTVLEVATAIAEETAAPTGTPAPPAAAPAVAPLAAPSRADSRPTRAPTPRRAAGPTPTLEPTPTQDRAPASIPPTEPQPEARPVPRAARAPTNTPATRRPAAPTTGTLAPGGTFSKFEFSYPGDRSVYTVNLYVEPDDHGVLKNAGFIVYGPNGEEIVRGGAQPGKRPNVSANVINTRPGRYTVQIQNYDPRRSITYRVELVTGAPPKG